MTTRAWLACRVALALVLMISFYVLAICVAFGLLWIGYADMTYTRNPNGRLIFFCVVGAFSVLWSIVPRPDRFEAPGPDVDRARQPRLFEALSEVAAATSQQMPADVYLVNDINAFVTQRGGFMGFGSRRVMGLGLPLMHAVTVQEFKAILAHEFGHYHSGDVALGPWIHKTRAAIGRTIQRLSNSMLRVIFVWYGRLFLRVTHAISRRQEFIADQVAAQAAGAEAMISGLRKVHAAAPAFHSYWYTELTPVLGAGYRPPVNAGFAQFLQNRHVATQLEAVVGKEEAEGQTAPYDTHPSLRDRVGALKTMPSGSRGDSRPASSLLSDISTCERQVLEAVSLDLAALKHVEWEQVTDIVWVPMWRQRVAQHGHLLRNMTIGTISISRAELMRLGSSLFAPSEAQTDDLRVGRAWQLIIAGIGLALAPLGWTIETPIGDEVVLRRAAHEFRPWSEAAAVIEGRTTLDEWRARCVSLGIADVPMSTLAQPT